MSPVETVIAERAPTLTLPRKRERGQTALGATSSHSNVDALLHPHERSNSLSRLRGRGGVGVSRHRRSQ